MGLSKALEKAMHPQLAGLDPEIALLFEINRALQNVAHKVEREAVVRELLVRRQLTHEEMKLYLLFLRAYLHPRTERTRAAFFSKAKTCRLIANEARIIKNQTDQKFVGRNQSRIYPVLQSLIKKDLIHLAPHEIELRLMEELFENVSIRRRRTWNTNTLQPKPSKGPMGLPVDFAVANPQGEQHPMTYEEVRDYLEEFYLLRDEQIISMDLAEVREAKPENLLMASRNMLYEMGLETEKFSLLNDGGDTHGKNSQ